MKLLMILKQNIPAFNSSSNCMLKRVRHKISHTPKHTRLLTLLNTQKVVALCPDMTEKLLTGALNLNTNIQKTRLYTSNLFTPNLTPLTIPDLASISRGLNLNLNSHSLSAWAQSFSSVGVG